MKLASAILVAVTCAPLDLATAQPFDRSNVCEVLAVAQSTVLSDNLPPDQRADRVRVAYNFEDENYECRDRTYPTQQGNVIPAYFGIGFSDDYSQALVGIETMPADGSGIGRGYSCVLQRNASGKWEAVGCRAVDVAHHSPAPDPMPVP